MDREDLERSGATGGDTVEVILPGTRRTVNGTDNVRQKLAEFVAELGIEPFYVRINGTNYPDPRDLPETFINQETGERYIMEIGRLVKQG